MELKEKAKRINEQIKVHKEQGRNLWSIDLELFDEDEKYIRNREEIYGKEFFL